MSLQAAVLIEQTKLREESRESIFEKIQSLDKSPIYYQSDELMYGKGEKCVESFAALARGVAMLTMLGHQVPLFGVTFGSPYQARTDGGPPVP